MLRTNTTNTQANTIKTEKVNFEGNEILITSSCRLNNLYRELCKRKNNKLHKPNIVTKIDEEHPDFVGKVLCTRGIGAGYTKRPDAATLSILSFLFSLGSLYTLCLWML